MSSRSVLSATLAVATCASAALLPWPSTASATGSATTLAAGSGTVAGTDLLVQGRVTSADAVTLLPAPLAGASVQVSWTPGLADARVGDELRPVTLARATTDRLGRYRVELRPGPALQRAAASNDGWVSFDVSVASQQGVAQGTSTSRRLLDGGWVASNPRGVRATTATESAGAPDPRDRLGALDDLDFRFDASLNGAAGRVAEALAVRTGAGRESREVRFPTVAPITPTRTATATATATASGSVPCSFVVTARPQRSARVVNWHNAGNSNATWRYGTRADSDLDVAFDAGGDGTWSLRGSYHVGNSLGASVSQTVKTAFNAFGRTGFRWTDGYYKPFGAGSYCNDNPSIPVYSKRRTATRWVAGVGNDGGPASDFQGCSVAPQNGYRTAYPVGSSFRKASSTATRIAAAADVGPIYIGASSGYSTELVLSWSSVRGRGIYLCGKRDDITGSPGVIHAQNR